MATYLGERFREEISTSKDYKMKVESEPDVSYQTGFLGFDFLNGTIIHVRNEELGLDYKYYSVGIVDGSMNMLIGRSGCGKTTFAIQIGYNIIRPYKTSTMFHDDIEGGSTEERRLVLSRCDNYEEFKKRYICRNTGVTAENFYERVKLIGDIKLNDREAYTYDTGKLDTHGNKIYKLEPTVYLMDSLSLLSTEKISEEEQLSGQMSTTATAKTNSQIFRRIIPLLKAANIILLVINHINDKVEINAFKKTKLQLGYLKDGETLPGGKVAAYLSNNIIRFDDSKLSDKDGLKIDGALVDVSLVKSRTNKAGKAITLVFNQDTGFDPDLSLFIMLKQHKLINGGGAYMYVGDNKDMKFRQSELKEKLLNDQEFAKVFTDACIPCLKELILDVQEESIFLQNSSVSTSILDKMNEIAV